MIRIGICDDEAIMREIVNNHCRAYFVGRDKEYSLVHYNSGEDVLKDTKAIDILFLDIEMLGFDGFTVAEKLRDFGRDPLIIFLTSHAEMMQKAFKVKAFRYLIKPLIVEEFYEAMDDAIFELLDKKMIDIEHIDGHDIVPVSKIVYIESIGDHTSIHEDNKNYVCNKTLKYWTERLGEKEFTKVSRTHVIAFKHFRGVKNKHATLSNKIEIPIARRRITQLKIDYETYIKSRVR